MNKIGRILILVSLLINQLSWPMAAWAQMADEPTPTPTPIETPADPTPTEVITTPTEAPAPTEPTPTETPVETLTPTPLPTETIVLPTETQTEPTLTEDDLITPTPTETVTIGETTSIEPVTAGPETTLLVVVGEKSQPSGEVQINNSADVNQNNQTVANSGDNQTITPVDSGQATIVTGQAVALANLVNVVNTTSIDSTIKIYLLNNVSGQVGQIDLNTAWNLLNNGGNNVNILTVDTTGKYDNVNINNLGVIQNQLVVTANSGGNQINGGDLNSIFTGNAYALANVFNLLNINLMNSRLFVGVINVDGSTLGDLILPNPDSFGLTGQSGNGGIGQINNMAIINTTSLTSADSGNNEIYGNGLIESGNSSAVSNIYTSTNLNLVNNNQMLIGLNLMGSWDGKIYNWDGAGTEMTGSNQNLFDISGSMGGGDDSMNTNIDNLAVINNIIATRAITGNNGINSAEGSSVIRTGNAWAMTNVSNLANLNLFRSNWFYGMINVIGDWKGNVIFAYPDVTMSLTVTKDDLKIGDETEIFVNFGNIGYDDSNDSRMEINLPDNLEYLSDSSGEKPDISGNKLVWQFGNIGSKTARTFLIKAKLVEHHNVTFRLVKPAIAADEYSGNNTIIVNGQVSTNKTEVSKDNNTAAVTIQVIVDGIQTGNTEGTLFWPKLMVNEKNNVNDWVYKNDIVSFEINGKNEGEATAYGSYLIHRIMDSKGNVLTQNKINIGNVGVSRAGKVTFGIPINFNLKGDNVLTSQSQWIGYTEKGEEVKSNISQSTFLVKFGLIKKLVVNEIKAAEPNAEVLGTSITADIGIDFVPYLLLFLMSSFWIIKQTKKWIPKK